jgi:CIC family chloride channel protein
MRKVTTFFERAARFFNLESWFRLLMLCVLVGVVAGLGAVLFEAGLNSLQDAVLARFLFKNHGPYAFLYYLIVPAIGGALSGILTVHRNLGEIRARIPIVKGICSILTIGSGGSAGKEGPIAQMGAGFGSLLGTLLKLSVRDRRILMLAGVAGGIGAIFKAPLAGALFAAEVLYRDPDFEHDAVIPGVISSVTAYSVFAAFYGYDRILQLGSSKSPIGFPTVGGNGGSELVHYAILSLFCALVAFLLVKTLTLVEKRIFHPLSFPRALKPALGGLALGAFVLLLIWSVSFFQSSVPQTLGGSQPEHIMAGGQPYLQVVVNSALDETKSDYWMSAKLAAFLCVVILAKILATSLTIGSGGSGGVLFPAVFLGGITGAAYAKAVRAIYERGWLPDWAALSPNARGGMILVGMGGVFAAATKTPIASLVMISEITGSYGLVVPLMITCSSAYILSRSFTLNEEQVRGIADSPAHRGEFLVDVLEGITVADAIDPAATLEAIPANMVYDDIMDRIKGGTGTVFPIVDEHGCLTGIFSLGDLRQIMNEHEVGTLIVAGDLGTTDSPWVLMETKLDEALRLFTERNIDEIPIVATTPPGQESSRSSITTAVASPHGAVGTMRVIGMVSRRDLISAYHRRLKDIRDQDESECAGSNVFVHNVEWDATLTPRRHPPKSKRAPQPGVSHSGLELIEDLPEDKRN